MPGPGPGLRHARGAGGGSCPGLRPRRPLLRPGSAAQSRPGQGCPRTGEPGRALSAPSWPTGRERKMGATPPCARGVPPPGWFVSGPVGRSRPGRCDGEGTDRQRRYGGRCPSRPPGHERVRRVRPVRRCRVPRLLSVGRSGRHGGGSRTYEPPPHERGEQAERHRRRHRRWQHRARHRPLVAPRRRRGTAPVRARLGRLRAGRHRRRAAPGRRRRAGLPRPHRIRPRRGPVRRACRRAAADLTVEQRRTGRERRRARPRTGGLPLPPGPAAGPARGPDTRAGTAQGAAGGTAGRGGARGAVPRLPAADGGAGRARGLPHLLSRAGPHPGPDEPGRRRRLHRDARPARRRPGAAGRLRCAGRPGGRRAPGAGRWR